MTASDKAIVTFLFHVASLPWLDTVDLPVVKRTVTRKEDYSTFRGKEGSFFTKGGKETKCQEGIK